MSEFLEESELIEKESQGVVQKEDGQKGNKPESDANEDPDKVIADLKEKLSTDETDLETKKDALIRLRKLLIIKRKLMGYFVITRCLSSAWCVAPLFRKVIENRLIEKVFPYLEHKEIDLQSESGRIVTNIAAGSSWDVNYLLQNGVIEKLMPLLYSSDEKLWWQAVKAYGNLAAEGTHVRSMVNKAEIIQRIVALTLDQTQILKDSTVKSADSLRNVQGLAWTISNCCDRKPRDYEIEKLFLPGLLALLECTDDEDTLESSCSALSSLSNGDDQQIQDVIDSGVLPSMMKIMHRDSLTNNRLRSAVIRVLGNITSGNESQTQTVIDCGGIKILSDHVTPKYSKTILQEVCWTLSNICAGSEEQVRAVVEYPNLLVSMVEMVNTAQFEVQKEMAWMLANIAEKGILSFTLRLHESGCVRSLLSLLIVHDTKLVVICLDTIYQIGKVLQEAGIVDEFEDFKDCIENNGGLDVIEQLQSSTSQQVYYSAMRILEAFFDATEEGEGAEDQQEVVNEG